MFYSHQKKTTADAHKIICEIYGENVMAIRTCTNWFKCFKNGDFNISERGHKNCSGCRAIVEEDELLALLNEYSAQLIRGLALQLEVDQSTIVCHLNAMRNVQKSEKWVHINI